MSEIFLNNLTNSSLKEQKGYKPRKAFVLSHLGLGDNIDCIGAVRYLSTCYDEVLVVCKKKYKKNLELFYNDDVNIKLYPVQGDKDISPKRGCSLKKFKSITNGMDLFLSGMHCLNKLSSSANLPFNFYEDMGINKKYCKEYFHINTPNQAYILQNKLKDIKEFIFIHNTASNGIIFSIEEMEKKFNFDKQNILIINPNYNVYKETDNYYNLAEQFLNHPLAFYSQVIINCNKLIVTDSSFFSLSVFLPIKTKHCYYISRDSRDYSQITNETNFTRIIK